MKQIGDNLGRERKPAPIFQLEHKWDNTLQPAAKVKLEKTGERFWCPACEDYRPDSEAWHYSPKHDATVCGGHKKGRKPKTSGGG